MSPDKLASEMLSRLHAEIAELSVKKNLLYGYVGAMRQLPAYISFSHRNPEFGNAELADKIALGLRHLVLTGEVSSELDGWIDLLDKEYVPSTEDFGSESAALEGALALIFLYKYSKTEAPNFLFEIFRGIIECILMSNDTSEILQELSNEQSIRRRQFELIRSSENMSDELLAQCLAIN